MQRCMKLALACAIVLGVAWSAAAQTQPTPVVRMGDWVEIGNEVFMNVIATADIRFSTTTNYDFDHRVRDRVNSRNPTTSSLYVGEGDFLQAESRIGFDMRYTKNLTMRVLAEAQLIYDGNLIDDTQNTSNPGAATSTTGIGRSTENNAFHVERFWVDYKFPNSPLRARVGADLWTTDQAGLLGDDDPRFALFLEFGPKKETQIYAAAVIQSESARLGLQNDNDFTYFTFGGSHKFGPHKVALDIAYFRDRFSGESTKEVRNTDTDLTNDLADSQQFDTVMVSPSYSGTIGPIRALAQFSLAAGSAKGNQPVGGTQPDFDVWAWAVVAHIEANLLNGVLKPFIGIIYGSGDDDATDDTLGGFNTLPQNEITLLTGNGHMGYLTTSPSVDPWGPAAPGRAGFAGGNLFRHTTGNVFSDRLGNTAHAGISTAYSNPGTLLIPVGVHIAPIKGHQVSLWYMYVGMTDSTVLEAVAPPGTRIDNSLYHELDLSYTWAPNTHFDVRLSGAALIPADGVKDIAEASTTTGCPCRGDDVALRGELRVRGQF